MYLGDLDHLINMSGCKDCSGVTEFNICITRSVSLKIPGKTPKKFYNKQEFVDFLNMYIEEKGISDLVRVVRKTSMSSKVHVLVNDSGIHSTKVVTAQNLDIRVVTSYEVFDCIRAEDQKMQQILILRLAI